VRRYEPAMRDRAAGLARASNAPTQAFFGIGTADGPHTIPDQGAAHRGYEEGAVRYRVSAS
jgi:hypothetical protein